MTVPDTRDGEPESGPVGEATATRRADGLAEATACEAMEQRQQEHERDFQAHHASATGFPFCPLPEMSLVRPLLLL